MHIHRQYSEELEPTFFQLFQLHPDLNLISPVPPHISIPHISRLAMVHMFVYPYTLPSVLAEGMLYDVPALHTTNHTKCDLIEGKE